jgi:hypothetical protein
VKGYLLDTNVISITAPANSARDQTVLEWLGRVPTPFPFCGYDRRDQAVANTARKRLCAKPHRWQHGSGDLHLCGRRVLPWTAQLLAPPAVWRQRQGGVSRGFADIAIPATASAHGW